MTGRDNNEKEGLVRAETIKYWGFVNRKLALDAAHQMQLVDGVPIDQLKQALIESGLALTDEAEADLNLQIAAVYSDETRNRVYARSSRKPSLDDYDENGE